MKVRSITYLLILAIFAISCSPQREEQNDLRVVGTTGMIADLVRNITLDTLAVEALMGPGVDPHLYKATHGDLVKLQEADIIFYNGLHLEGKMGEIFESLAKVKDCYSCL